MFKSFFALGIVVVLIGGCQPVSSLNDTIDDCLFHSIRIDFVNDQYAIGSSEFQDFDERITGYIPAEDEAQFYIITYDLAFCDFLNLNLNTHDYQLESIDNPTGWWFEVTTNMNDFEEILNGRIVTGFLKTKAIATEFPPVFGCLPEDFNEAQKRDQY